MTSLKIHLKPKARIFVNGAVLQVDRKVTIEFLNDVAFLLESHVIQEEEATTSLRQLYFIVQSMLVEPATKEMALALYNESHRLLINTFRNQDLLEGIVEVRDLVQAGRPFDALKKLRALFAIEDEMLFGKKSADLIVA